MKKNIYVLILSLVVVGGLAFTFGPFANGSGTNREIKNKTKPSQKTMSIAEKKTHALKERKKWEASPDGVKFKEWEVSPEGKKVNASYDKIKKNIKTFSNMEAMVTSVTFQRSGKSSGIKWLIVSINGEDYMMQFTPKDFEQLKNLKVNDKIIVRSRSAGF